MKKEFDINFENEGSTLGSGFIIVDENGQVDTSSIEDSFYKMLRNNEKYFQREAEEEFKDKIINELTSEDEEKLKEVHAKDYSGLDDEMSDGYENFLEELSSQEIREIIK